MIFGYVMENDLGEPWAKFPERVKAELASRDLSALEQRWRGSAYLTPGSSNQFTQETCTNTREDARNEVEARPLGD